MFIGSVLVAECLPLSPLYKSILRRKGCDEYDEKAELSLKSLEVYCHYIIGNYINSFHNKEMTLTSCKL